MATIEHDAIYLECLSFIQQEVKKISSELEFFFIKKLRDLVKRVKVPESFLEKGTEAGIVDCINSYVVRYHTLHFLEQMIGILLDREKRDNTHSPLFKKIKDDIKEDIKQVWRDETGEEF